MKKKIISKFKEFSKCIFKFVMIEKLFIVFWYMEILSVLLESEYMYILLDNFLRCLVKFLKLLNEIGDWILLVLLNCIESKIL